MMTGEEGKAITATIEYITGLSNIDITKINFKGFKWVSINYKKGDREYTISRTAFNEGVTRIRSDLNLALTLTGEF